MAGADDKSRRLAAAVRAARAGIDTPVFDASTAIRVRPGVKWGTKVVET